jgi:hypothetical protein
MTMTTIKTMMIKITIIKTPIMTKIIMMTMTQPYLAAAQVDWLEAGQGRAG